MELREKPVSQEDMYASFYPVGAVNFMKRQGLSGKILTTFEWGQYLIWELYPPSLVAYDGREETVYLPEVEENFLEFIDARPQWRQVLENYPPDLILLDKRMKIAKLIEKEPQWRQIYVDAGCVLFMVDKK